MEQQNQQALMSSLNLFPMLTVAFVVLKLCKVIDWSWWWVLVFVWAPLALYALVFIVCFFYYRAKAKRKQAQVEE